MSIAEGEGPMIRNLIAAVPPEVARWCALALVLLAPGSFIVMPIWWLARQVRRWAAIRQPSER
jgi:hypothetical protein